VLHLIHRVNILLHLMRLDTYVGNGFGGIPRMLGGS
jgi:hypothetical protein